LLLVSELKLQHTPVSNIARFDCFEDKAQGEQRSRFYPGNVGRRFPRGMKKSGLEAASRSKTEMPLASGNSVTRGVVERKQIVRARRQVQGQAGGHKQGKAGQVDGARLGREGSKPAV
jgi:hypothetical protein